MSMRFQPTLLEKLVPFPTRTLRDVNERNHHFEQQMFMRVPIKTLNCNRRCSWTALNVWMLRTILASPNLKPRRTV